MAGTPIAECAFRWTWSPGSGPLWARVNRLAQAEELLHAGAVDFVSIARAFLADPEVLAKGRPSPSRPVNICLACDQACIDHSVVDEPSRAW